MTKTKPQAITFRDWLRVSLQRVAVFHFMLLIAYAVQIIVMDAWHVIVPEIVLERWLAGTGLAIVTAIVWYLAHNRNNDIPTYKRLLFSLVTADVVFAAFNVYTQRGMAAKSVVLFAVPIVASAILLNRAALYATAVFSAAAYIASAVSYFVLNFNEGYKTELYSEVVFYSALFFILAGLLSTVVHFGGSTADN